MPFLELQRMKSMTLKSYAKINLGLVLLKKRNDGYHDIATVFQQIDLYDALTFQPRESGISLQCSGFPVPCDEKNLAYRAFKLFSERGPFSGGIGIGIEKRIPAGAGLGGGSSNAAVTLIAANQICGRPFKEKDLERLAAEIGSDVPFFICGGTALGLGRGEILEPLQIPGDFYIVLLLPDLAVSTAWAYGESRIALTKVEKLAKFRAIFEKFSPQALKNHLVNELEDVVFKRHPELYELKQELYKRDAFYASMSGSGSTVYGLFGEKRVAESAVSHFSRQTGLAVHLCRPISGQSFRSVAS
jgi:4-diphosphocytidyl-2-C-methyl-D-erythritol kinase